MGKVLPILFNTDMVQAILDGRKTVTRRLIKNPYFVQDNGICPQAVRTASKGSRVYREIGDMPYPDRPYKRGDVLYVRETWMLEEFYDGESLITFRAGGKKHISYEVEGEFYRKLLKFVDDYWTPSIHMPKEVARIWLKVMDVRVERLQDITEEQAAAEGGIDNRGFIHSPENEHDNIHSAREHFIKIWDSTVKKKELAIYGWDVSPWVWVIEFECCEKPECI